MKILFKIQGGNTFKLIYKNGMEILTKDFKDEKS